MAKETKIIINNHAPLVIKYKHFNMKRSKHTSEMKENYATLN